MDHRFLWEEAVEAGHQVYGVIECWQLLGRPREVEEGSAAALEWECFVLLEVSAVVAL